MKITVFVLFLIGVGILKTSANVQRSEVYEHHSHHHSMPRVHDHATHSTGGHVFHHALVPTTTTSTTTTTPVTTTTTTTTTPRTTTTTTEPTTTTTTTTTTQPTTTTTTTTEPPTTTVNYHQLECEAALKRLQDLNCPAPSTFHVSNLSVNVKSDK